jgi:hypothetical protein
MRTIAAALLSAGILATSLVPADAAPLAGTSQTPDITRAYPGESYTQYRRYYGRPYYARPYYGRPYYRHHNNGAAVAAGVAGLAAGALVAGAIANQAYAAPPPPPATVDPQLAAYCARKFRSYDPMSGTYLSFSGERIVCTY